MKKTLLLFAILAFSIAMSACVNNFAVQELNNKAEEYLNKGDAQAAICRLKASLDLDNEVYQTHYNLAAAYNAAGNYDEAVREASKALELKPDLYDAYYLTAAAKEAAAYKLLDAAAGGNENPDENIISAFNLKVQETIDAYNEYLKNVPNAPEKDKINEKIQELNQKINKNLNNSDSGENSEDS